MDWSLNFKEINTAERRTRILFVFAASVLAYLVAFQPAIFRLVGVWQTKEEFSHGYFIPLVSAWMIYERQSELSSFGKSFSNLAFPFLILSFSCLMLGTLTYIWTLQYIGLVIGTFAFAYAFGGVQLARVVAVPLVFLFFMVPPPPLIVYLMTSEMQLISSKLGVLFIRALNMPVFLTGNVIDLGTLKLEVVEACSGLRYLFPFLSLGFLMAYIFRGPLWQKATLFLITVPITVLMNSIRIAITAFMSDRFGADYAEGFSHFVEGWMIFVFCILFLLLTALFMSRVLNKRPLLASLNVPSIGAVGPEADPKADQKQLIYLCLLIGLVTVSLFVRSPVLATPDRQRLLNLPYELDEWRFLNTETLSKETEDVLNADDYVVANFADEAGKLLNVYVAYLDSQEDGKSWHSPRQCLPGGGWQIGEITATALPIESRGQSISVNRALIQQGDERLLVYFWFEQRGRTITNELMIKYYLMVDTIRKKRSDGALVRILTEIDPDETVDEAEQRLISFTTSVVDELPAYVPQ